MKQNIFKSIPQDLAGEVFEEIIKSPNIRIERIVSRGQASPAEGWYDQAENEWVIVLQGSGALLFENGEEVVLREGDYINIPAHTRHKVLWTDVEHVTIWLAFFYS